LNGFARYNEFVWFCMYRQLRKPLDLSGHARKGK